MRRVTGFSPFVLALAVVGVSAGGADASGYYNMPTSLPQCLGVGYGPGYHAPLLLGPMMRSGIASQPLKRLPAAPQPPAPYGFAAPSVWAGGSPAPAWGTPAYAAPAPAYYAPPVVTQPSVAPAPGWSGPLRPEAVPAPAPVR